MGEERSDESLFGYKAYIIVAHFSCGTCCNFSQVAVKYGFKVHCLESNFEEFH